MDSSQSSDFFTVDNTDLSCNTEMDTQSYGTLISNIKAALNSDVEKEMEKTTFPYHFTMLLDDCCECISQSLDIIINMLHEPNVEISKMTDYMMDAISILQMLSNYIKIVMKNISMSCCNMKTFPTTTGRIIMMVYTHCQDSESLYGVTLSRVEIQLKQMFQACHELQLTYLMLIEKYFIFNLAVKEELDILIEVLEINLKIGEIVQTLDVKTMAEQWKAYTGLCEKYASCLTDRNIYYGCTKVLCVMVKNNIKTATEEDQEEKIVSRSLKVSSFIVKILLKICCIFKNATMKSFDHVLELLILVYVNSCLYPSTTKFSKSQQFINQFNSNVTNPTDCLLRELLLDSNFVNFIMSFDIETLLQDEKLLGYIHIILALIKSVIQRKVDRTERISKTKLINYIFSLLPHCDIIWFNNNIFDGEAKSGSNKGLYEELLSHATALSATMNSDEYCTLEKTMIVAILSTDCYCALFSSNLWVLLARLSGRQLLFVQLTSLCKIYQKMENNQLFHNSPQEVHLRHTINGLFLVMPNEDKLKISKQFSWNDERNVSIWSCLRIVNLPQDVRYTAEEEIAERLKLQLNNITSDAPNVGVDTLVKTMTLAGSCSFINDNEVAECVIKAWEMICPKNNELFIICGDMDKVTLWYFHYVEALVALTNSLEKKLHQQPTILVKILHVISEIITTNNIELNLVLTPVLCRIALCDIYDENKKIIESLLVKTFIYLFGESSTVVKLKLCEALRKNRLNKNIEKIISIINEDDSLNETLTHFNKHDIEMKKQLLVAKDFKYQHKCIKSSVQTLKNSNRSNFDLADIDTLFGNDSDSEQPVCKKVKLNDDADIIIARLENDASLLCKMKENIFTDENVNKIRNVCVLLQNIID